MEDLSKYTPIELQKLANDIKSEHERLKKEITNDTFAIEELEKKINEKLSQLKEVEKMYVALAEEIDRR